jgi:hypothetical protein
VVDTCETRRLDGWIDVYDFNNIPPAALMIMGRIRREGGCQNSPATSRREAMLIKRQLSLVKSNPSSI